MKRFVPPPTDSERELNRAASEILRSAGYGTDGLPHSRRRAQMYTEYRRRTTLAPFGNGRRR